MTSLDQLDSDILGKLDENARIGMAELSVALGIARNTAQSRIRRMEDAGVLQGFSPCVDLETAGAPVQAFVALELDQRKMTQVVSALTQFPHVLEINTQLGREDLLARVAASTHAVLQAITAQIIEIDGVRHTRTTLITSTPLAYRTQPLLEHLTHQSGFGRSTPAPH